MSAENRKKQAQRYARILLVARYMRHTGVLPVEKAKYVAEQLGCSSRTVYWDLAVIREANKIYADIATPDFSIGEVS